MQKLQLSTAHEAYELMDGDFDALESLPLDMQADLLVDFDKWSHELTSEAMHQYDNNSAEWIYSLFSDNRPDDPFINMLRAAYWHSARTCIQEAIAEAVDVYFNPLV